MIDSYQGAVAVAAVFVAPPPSSLAEKSYLDGQIQAERGIFDPQHRQLIEVIVGLSGDAAYVVAKMSFYLTLILQTT